MQINVHVEIDIIDEGRDRDLDPDQANLKRNDDGPEAGIGRGTETRAGIGKGGVVRETEIETGVTEGNVPREIEIAKENGTLFKSVSELLI